MNEIGHLIKNDIISELIAPLNKSGIFYRVFARGKSVESITRKLVSKREKYQSRGEKMQDILGIRIVFYFLEDVVIFYNHLKTSPDFIGESNTELDLQGIHDIENLKNLTDKVFMPQRLNLVFRISNESYCKELEKDLETVLAPDDAQLIDNTYEVQLRTVLSEGWHEVEHDLRYKSINEEWWNYCLQESRMLNGIYASLETNERAMEHLFSNIAYKNYKKRDWDAMLRNHFRIRLQLAELSKTIIDLLNRKKTVAKSILRFERSRLFAALQKMSIPLTLSNVVYLINRIEINDDEIRSMEPAPISSILDNAFIHQNRN